jgi:transposase InsO family protein
MEILLELPEDVAQRLTGHWRDLPRAALESLALEGYRSGALTQSQVRRMLGFQTRMEVDGFLKEHGVYLEYTLEDLDREAESSRRVWQQRQAELAGEAENEECRAR